MMGSFWKECFVFSVYLSYLFTIVPADDSRKRSNALIVSDVQSSSDEEVSIEVDEELPKDVFQPSKDWKPIKPGQMIPKGLHVRVNLATGMKEAKLLETKDMDHEKIPETSDDDPFSPQKLKEALKKIKTDDVTNVEGKISKSKYRSLEELKRELSESDINIKSETDILLSLLERYRSCKEEEEKVKILKDLEYISHQFDVAQDLVRHEGLQLLIPDLNSSLTEVKTLVCATLGAAMQGNPRVQIAVLEHNGLSILIRIVMLDPSLTVRARALFAMSCLLRNFPFAQKRLVENGGIQLISGLLRNELSADSNSLKIKLKVVTLLNDLLVEQDYAQNLSSENKDSGVYFSFSFRKLLVEHNFCDLIGDLLLVPDKDVPERVLPTMKSLSPDCKFQKQLSLLQNLEKKITKELELGEPDEDKSRLLEIVNLLLNRIAQKDEL